MLAAVLRYCLKDQAWRGPRGRVSATSRRDWDGWRSAPARSRRTPQGPSRTACQEGGCEENRPPKPLNPARQERHLGEYDARTHGRLNLPLLRNLSNSSDRRASGSDNSPSCSQFFTAARINVIADSNPDGASKLSSIYTWQAALSKRSVVSPTARPAPKSGPAGVPNDNGKIRR